MYIYRQRWSRANVPLEEIAQCEVPIANIPPRVVKDAPAQAAHHRATGDAGSVAELDSRGASPIKIAAATAAMSISKSDHQERKKGAAGGAVAAPSLDDIRATRLKPLTRATRGSTHTARTGRAA